MKSKTKESVQLVDQLAKTAHEMIDQVHKRAAAMEESIGNQSKETGKRVVAGIEREVGGLEKYIEENPMMAAVFAFGLGVFGSRVMKAMNTAAATGITEAEQTKETKKSSVSKAA
jgi:ElaB/YqjD/DUF883 family membrane-anchored ribosome-binding protein